MKPIRLGHPLIGELLADPAAFKERGRTYELLQEYFADLPVETLRPLLQHEDLLIKHAAIWVASELGHRACQMLDSINALAYSEDRYLAYHALEIVFLCARGAKADLFVALPCALENDDDVIRVLAMRLIAKAVPEQLQTASQLMGKISKHHLVHTRGLLVLAAIETADSQEVTGMMLAESSLARVYGAIAAVKLKNSRPDLFRLVQTLDDKVVLRFASEAT